VVLDDPEVIQGMGGRISGIIETTPIHIVFEGIGAERVLDPRTAKIDQIAGMEKTFMMGYSKIGITLTSAEQASDLRNIYGKKIMIFGVHTTGITE
jgi:hypothetical protein